MACWLIAVLTAVLVPTGVRAGDSGTESAQPSAGADDVFRPQAGEFPPLDKAHAYRGELVFVDHANRRGSIRVEGTGVFRANDPHPFAMLPCGIVRYHGATAALRDLPLGTVMHVRGFLPPDPAISAVPVLPVDNKLRDANHNRGAGVFPAENHVLLLEDEISRCLREQKIWRLLELQISNRQGMIAARCESLQGNQAASVAETMTFDAATRIWRGREYLAVDDLIAEGSWPAEGKQNLAGQGVHLGITWRPTPGGVFTRFHISDIWLDEEAVGRTARIQNETHKAFIRSRWVPAWVDSVEYGQFGKAIVTATLFGGIDESLYADFKEGERAMMAPSENTLKHWAGGSAGTSQIASKGPILKVLKSGREPPLGSSGIQITFETDLVTEGIRPTRVVRVRPASWPDLHVPREEYLQDSRAGHEDRFPTPAIFPTY